MSCSTMIYDLCPDGSSLLTPRSSSTSKMKLFPRNVQFLNNNSQKRIPHLQKDRTSKVLLRLLHTRSRTSWANAVSKTQRLFITRFIPRCVNSNRKKNCAKNCLCVCIFRKREDEKESWFCTEEMSVQRDDAALTFAHGTIARFNSPNETGQRGSLISARVTVFFFFSLSVPLKEINKSQFFFSVCGRAWEMRMPTAVVWHLNIENKYERKNESESFFFYLFVK